MRLHSQPTPKRPNASAQPRHPTQECSPPDRDVPRNFLRARACVRARRLGYCQHQDYSKNHLSHGYDHRDAAFESPPRERSGSMSLQSHGLPGRMHVRKSVIDRSITAADRGSDLEDDLWDVQSTQDLEEPREPATTV